MKSYVDFVENAESNTNKNKNFDSSYLKNINDFSIKAAGQINNTRVIKFAKKNAEMYNCIDDRKKGVSPPKYQIDKWGQFYEKYFD